MRANAYDLDVESELSHYAKSGVVWGGVVTRRRAGGGPVRSIGCLAGVSAVNFEIAGYARVPPAGPGREVGPPGVHVKRVTPRKGHGVRREGGTSVAGRCGVRGRLRASVGVLRWAARGYARPGDADRRGGVLVRDTTNAPVRDNGPHFLLSQWMSGRIG
ncbi:hypothetical protein GCM10011578_065870 [Streptomyces fuscichromogenes]|uniref:Uncharacterized protein n=1 Tax=Streptomyces fuscichromogenes TaxID=1324013 RepID=A0A917XJB2_9ACTN|nr:hypothetical protein GCM10011578_065870 [Streptomyces fuscichromogenes]